MDIKIGDRVSYNGEVWEFLWTIPPDTKSDRLRLARPINDEYEEMTEALITEVQLVESYK